MQSLSVPPALKFGPYVVDLAAGEVRKNGYRIRLQEKPLRVLVLLAERQGQLVTREELKNRLWPDETFVDFEAGLNTAVSKLRDSLLDSADKPRYIETIPRRGYRFLVPVEFQNEHAQEAGDREKHQTPQLAAAPTPTVATLADPQTHKEPHAKSAKRAMLWISLAAIVLLVAGGTYWLTRGRPALAFHSRDTVLIADFENQTGDPRFDDALLTAFTVSIGQSRYVNVFPQSRVQAVLKRMGRSGTERATVPLAREICTRENVRGLIANTITRTGQEFELTTELIDPETGATVRSYKERSYGEDHILDTLDSIAGQVRADLGESLHEIQNADRPLPQVTTSSLTALKEYAEASSLWGHTKYADAVTLFKAAIELDPNFAMAHAALGRAYCSYIYYQLDLGRQEYEKALALAPRLTEREKMIIEIHKAADLDQVEEAYGLYRAYLTSYPEDWVMLRDYANLLRLHGRQAEAIEQHKRILAIAPDDVNTWIEMATAYSVLEKYSVAVQAYSHAFQIAPDWLTAGSINREYGKALIGNGEEHNAVAIFSDLLEKPDKRGDGLRSLALLALYHGKYSEAQARLLEALQINENMHDAFAVARTHFLLAVVAEGRGDNGTRLQQLDAAVLNLKTMGPKVEWGSIVGQEYVRAGALAKAEKIAEFISPLSDSHDMTQKGYVRLLQGAITAEKGDPKKAVGDLTPMVDPLYGRAVNGLTVETIAHAYQLAGNLDQATIWYEKIASPLSSLSSWEPQQRWASARYQLAVDYQKRGQTEKAGQTLATLLDLWKDGDANLPLRKAALLLQAQLSGGA